MSDFVLQNPVADTKLIDTAEKLSHATCIAHVTSYFEKRCGVVLPDFFSWNSEIADVIGWDSRNSYMIEVKVSRADFLKDKKKGFRRVPEMGMGNFRFYACPTGLIKPDELPENWGLLYVSDTGRVRRVKPAFRQKRNKSAELHLLYYYARRANFCGVHKTILDHRMYPKESI